MRHLAILLLLAVGCAKHAPAPVAAPDPIKADAAAFCAVTPGTPDQWGPGLAKQAQTDELKAILAELKGSGSSQVVESRLRELVKRGGVEPCPALAMFAPRPAAP
jgi:hypothetical protein